MRAVLRLRNLLFLLFICVILILCQTIYLTDFLKQNVIPDSEPEYKLSKNNEYLEFHGYEYEHVNFIEEENSLKVWPEQNKFSDRIVEQLNYIPKYVKENPVVIYLPTGLGRWNIKPHDNIFETLDCKVKNCRLSADHDDGESADAALFYQFAVPDTKPSNQIWIMYILENPIYTSSYRHLDNKINYSASYRYDADFVAPYEKFHYIRGSEYDSTASKVNYALHKTKQIAWFVSNCQTTNHREQFAMELNIHIKVDIYGGCGQFKCSRKEADNCFELLKNDYKFYLSFENANCQDYITEKFFLNGLQNNVIPIVMGAKKNEYQRVAPNKSFIHKDDFKDAAALAKYLNYLDKNDTAYNEYFDWKRKGRYEFMNTKFWCRVCALLNDPYPKVYESFDQWWRGPGVCERK